MVDYLKNCHVASERRACRLVGIARRVYSYQSCKDPQTALRLRMKELAMTRMRYGYRKIGTCSSVKASLTVLACCTVFIVRKACLYAIGRDVAPKHR